MIDIDKMRIVVLLLLAGLFVACSTMDLYVKMSEEEVIKLAKEDSLYAKISKIITPSGETVSKGEALGLFDESYFGERFIDPKTDSIVVKVRKARRTDFKMKQKIGFYLNYGTYADTITTQIDINCTKMDSLLLVIYNNDQANRTDFNESIGEYNEIKSEIDAKNQQVLFNIIEQCGFPNSQRNNKKSVEYAWIILLHADIQFQKEYYGHIKKATKRGDLDKVQLAYFEDKMSVNGGKEQKYGTQLAYDEDGNMVLAPVDNIRKVNKRRKKIGLLPVKLK